MIERDEVVVEEQRYTGIKALWGEWLTTPCTAGLMYYIATKQQKSTYYIISCHFEVIPMKDIIEVTGKVLHLDR